MPDGPRTDAGKNSAPRPAAQREQRLGGREDAGHGHHAPRLAIASTSASTFGLTINRPPASATRAQSAALSTVPAPIRQSLPKRRLSRSIEAKRLGRIQRHLDQLEAAVDQRLDDGLGLVGADAAQDGDAARRFTVGHETGSVMS